MLYQERQTVKKKDSLIALERENLLYRSYIDIAGVMILVLDDKGNVKMVNKKTCDILGYSKKEIVGKNWFKNFLPSQISEQTQKHISVFIKGNDPEDFYENPVLTREKKERLISWHNAVIREPDGNISGLVSSGEDVTESRRIQNEMLIQSRNSEFMYLLSRGISDTTDLADLLKKASNILREYPDILGGKMYIISRPGSAEAAEEIVFGRKKSIIEKDEHIINSCQLNNILDSNLYCIETAVLDDNGKELKAYSCAYKMNTKYETLGVIVVFCSEMNATLNNFLMLASAELGRAIKRKKIEIEIKESREKFSTIFNFIPDALAITNIDTACFMDVNKGFEELTGYTKELVLNKSAIKLKTWTNPEERQSLLDKVLSEGKTKNFLTTIRKKNGKEIAAMFSAALIELEGINCMLTSVRDISDQIKIQNEILSAKELLEKISFMSPLYISLYDVNHDKILYLNKSFLQSLGYSKEDLRVIERMNAGKDTNKYFYHPEDDERVTEFIRNLQILNDGDVAKIEFRLKDSKNEWQWVHQTAAIFQKRTDKLPLLTINVFENITERKEAEVRLNEHYRERDLLYEAGKQISSTLDLDMIYDRMYDIISQIADCTELIVVQYEPKTHMIVFKYLRVKDAGVRSDISKVPQIPLAPKGYGIVSEVIRTGESVIISDYKEWFKKVKTSVVISTEIDPKKDKGKNEGPKSAMIVPIKLENKILGVVQIYSKKHSAYSPGQLRFVESLMHQVALANKNASVFESAQHEITERKSAQEKLKKSEKNLRQFAESVPDVLYRFNLNSMQFSFLSPVLETMLGYTVNEASDDPVSFIKKIVHPDDFSDVNKKVHDYIKHGRVEAPLHVECRIVGKDSGVVFVRNTMKFEYKEGNLYAVIGVMSDVSKEKKIEEDRRATIEKIIRHQSALLELSGIDADLNESVKKITENVTSALMVSRASVWNFIDEKKQIEVKDMFIKSEKIHYSGEVLDVSNYDRLLDLMKTENIIINGNLNRNDAINGFARDHLFSHGTVYCLISPFRYQGKVIGSLCLECRNPDRTEWTPEEIDFAISVTGFISLAIESHERKFAELEIKKSLKDKEMLLREIHHRVKNNLQVISSMLYLQASKSSDPVMIAGLIESQNRVKSMVLIHEKLYKSENLASFNYSEYIADLTNSIFRSYKLESSKVKLELDIGDIILDTDAAVHCGLIINELVSNSMKHAFPGDLTGTILIRFTKDEHGDYLLLVKDDGVGIKDKDKFDSKGTLGMQLIHTLVDQLNGTMEISNGSGSTFTIKFSLNNKDLNSMKKARIMVVEDQMIIALEIKERIENLGHEVIAMAKSGDKAIAYAVELKPDLILMDIKIEGEIDGIETAEQIKKTLDCPIIYLTAYADDKTIERAKLTEPYAYIVKPLDERELKSSIVIALYKSEISAKLKESELRYRTMINSMEGMVYMIDKDFNLIINNENAETRIKRDKTNKKCFELLYNQKKTCRHCSIDDLRIGNTSRKEFMEPGGSKWFYMITSPVNISEDKKYFQNLVFDITEVKRNEEVVLEILQTRKKLPHEFAGKKP